MITRLNCTTQKKATKPSQISWFWQSVAVDFSLDAKILTEKQFLNKAKILQKPITGPWINLWRKKGASRRSGSDPLKAPLFEIIQRLLT